MKKWMINLLIGVFAAVFLVSGFFLLRYYIGIWENQKTYRDLASLVDRSHTDPTKETGAPAEEETEDTGPQLVQVQDPETGEMVEVLADYAELYLINNDLVGWISIADTNINYPVVQDPENKDYYLYRDFYKNWNKSGCLYAREVCNVAGPSDNITIYGHNTNGGGVMFHDLNGYTQKSFWEAHQYIRFDTLTEYHTYQIIAVFKTSANLGDGFSYYAFVDAETEAEFDEYVKTCKDLSFYDTGLSASYGDKLITLSTCEYTLDNGRLVVVAKRIGE